MSHRWVVVSLAAGVAIAMPVELSAQQVQPYRQAQAPKQRQTQPPLDPLDVEELTPSQIKRAQELDQPSSRNAGFPKPAAPKPPATPARAVACSGAFAKDSSHLKLATVYKSENVDFTEVDATEGKKLMASVLFPKDPKRRLEVWWANEAARSETYLIVINGQSTWTAPKGLRLGLQLAALEKLNGKPFKFKGFDKDGVGLVSDWQGGALEQLPGGCRVGVYLKPDAKAPADARAAMPNDKEFLSADATARAAKPAVSEIIIGY